MKTILEIKERLVEITGDFRNLANKEELGLNMSCEEYEVMDALIVERDTLNWVLTGKAIPIAYRC
jgi:hypothetical protein